jgi:DNA-binding response OmpR family regulator
MLKQIAIVEDDALLREELKHLFEQSGYAVHEALHADGLVDILRHHNPGMIILDINLPGRNGYDIAHQVRASHPNIGIIMLTANSRSDHHVRGYHSGADIYLTKPTDTRELLAACSSLERRLQDHAHHSTLVLDISGQRLIYEKAPFDEASMMDDAHPGAALGSSVALTLSEFLILRGLALSPEDELATGDAFDILAERMPERKRTRRALENIVSRLRGKATAVGADGSQLIRSVRGHGYVLGKPVVVRS